MKQPAMSRTREDQMDFEARRLHNLLGLLEDSKTLRERLRAADSVARALRRYLSEFYDLEANRGR